MDDEKNVPSVIVEAITSRFVNNINVLMKVFIRKQKIHRCILFISLTLYWNDISAVHNSTSEYFINACLNNRKAATDVHDPSSK